MTDVKKLEIEIKKLEEKENKITAKKEALQNKKEQIEIKQKLEDYHKIKEWFREKPEAQKAFFDWVRSREFVKNDQ